MQHHIIYSIKQLKIYYGGVLQLDNKKVAKLVDELEELTEIEGTNYKSLEEQYFKLTNSLESTLSQRQCKKFLKSEKIMYDIKKIELVYLVKKAFETKDKALL